MKATSVDVVQVVADVGGSVERDEITYQLRERLHLDVGDSLIDDCIEAGELEENGSGLTVPEAFGDVERRTLVKRKAEKPSVGTNASQANEWDEEVGEFKPRPCDRCDKDFVPGGPFWKICPDCKKGGPAPGGTEPPPPAPEPSPDPEPDVPAGQSAFPLRRDRRARRGAGWTDEEIIERLQLWAELTGAPPTKLDLNPAKLLKAANRARDKARDHLDRLAFYQDGDWPSEATLRDHFGSFSAALVAAGFEARPGGRQPVGKTPTRPKALDEGALNALWERLADARSNGGAEDLRSALYDLGAAALTEADRIGK